jgi:tetratricopeptide (TPR) repeat protein
VNDRPPPGRAVVRAWLAAFGLALLVHVPAWLQYGADPFSTSLVSDALAYDRWAGRIASQGLAAEPVFHQSPLFPWLLSLVHPGVAGGTAARAALPLQIALGSLAASLLVPLGAVWFRALVPGVAAAAVALLHAPVVFHGLKLLPLSLALATQALALLLLGIARERGSGALAAAAGAATGVAALARAEVLLFVPFALLAVALPAERASGRRLGAAGAFLVGVLLGIAPATVHNARQGDFVPIAASGGENLFIGNQRDARGDHTPLDPRAGDIFSQRALAMRIAEEAAGGTLRPSQVSAYWRGRALGEIRSDLPGWLRLELRKLGRALHPGDPTDMYSLALERGHYLGWLHVLAAPPWLLLGLGAVGVALALRRAPARLWPLAAWALLHLGVLLVFFVSTRLRLPLLFALTPFAGLAIADGITAWRRGRRGPVLATVLALAAATVVSGVASYRVPPREVVRLASVLSAAGRLDEALAVLRPVVEGDAPYALALDQAGWVLQKQQRWEAAAARYAAALAGDLPDLRARQTHSRLGEVLERLGRHDEARVHHDAATGGADADAGAWFARGMFLLRRGDRAGARRDFERAARLAPGWPAPRAELERLGRD